MYTGISGMLTSSQGMSVVSNNLANTNTVGFKGSKTTFEDTFYAAVNSSQGVSQIGTGSSLSAIYGDWSQGSYETSTDATDLAIDGDGFFMVCDSVSGDTYYTRAGDFRFDSSGYLVNASGLRVQGWAVDQDTGDIASGIGDIVISSFQSPPSPTTALSMYFNLNSTSDDESTSAANPYFAMFENWDGTADSPLGDGLYAYQNTIKVYDENGSAHTLTVYFDKVDSDSVTGESTGTSTWEFVVTCNATEDGRTIDGQSVGATSAAGVLMIGTLTFSSSGELTGMGAYTLNSGASGDLKDLSNWTLADISDNGFATFTANFTGASNASYTGAADAVAIELDLGLGSSKRAWDAATASNASVLGTSAAALGNFVAAKPSKTTTTSYNASSSTLSQAQNGYASGFLQSLSVDTDGTVTANYSNGQITDLYKITLANFTNPDGLQREGSNLFSATRDSGEAVTGVAGTGSLGEISANSLEQSNVDMGTELVRMITLQRMYDASSKIISTADTMLQTVIALKR
jgi:flagellar hook protein FlgE